MRAWPSLAVMWILGCPSTPPPPPPEEAPAWPMLMPKNIEDCLATPYPEISNICRLGFSVAAVKRGEEAITWESCAAVSEPIWREECHFLVAETLAREGKVGKALAHCATSGGFASNCAVHTAWNTRPFTQSTSSADVASATGIETILTGISAASRDTATPQHQRHLDLLSASAWFELYYGSGLADPTAAKAAKGPGSADARTAFAWEVVRLVGVDAGTKALVDRVLAVWRGDQPPVRGAPLPKDCWLGRNTKPLKLASLGARTTVHTVHYGERFLGDNEAEDLVIATLEALYFDPSTQAGTFLPWLDDPRPRVRWTAARLALLLFPPKVPLSPELERSTAGWSPEEVQACRAQRRPPWSGSANREGCL